MTMYTEATEEESRMAATGDFSAEIMVVAGAEGRAAAVSDMTAKGDTSTAFSIARSMASSSSL